MERIHLLRMILLDGRGISSGSQPALLPQDSSLKCIHLVRKFFSVHDDDDDGRVDTARLL